MNDQEYNKLIETLKEKYFLERYITKGYIFKIKDKKYKTILGYLVREITIGLCALLVIFQDDAIDIDYIFGQTAFICIINIRNNKYEIYVRNGIENYKKLDYFPNFYSVFFKSMKFSTLLDFHNLIKGLELFFVRILIVLLRFTIPPLCKKIWKYYTNPYNRVVRKKDIDKLPF